MTKSITSFEAPALVDAHSGMTKLDLYERLSDKPSPMGAAGLTSFLAEGVIAFAAQDMSWSKVVRHDRNADVCGVEGHARAWLSSDADGELIAIFQHVPQFVHSASWARTGVPPRTVQLSATWASMIFGVKRVAVVVLADKRIVTYWVEPSQGDVDALRAGAADMARRLAEKNPPAVDSGDAKSEQAPAKADAADVDLDALYERWRGAREVAAVANSEVKLADHAYEAASEALKAKLPKGSSHEMAGFKVNHNAKSGRLIEEKTDAAYF
jgi:hypothetical protein